MFVLSQCTIDVTDLEVFFLSKNLINIFSHLHYLVRCRGWSDFVLKKYDITACLTYYRLHFVFFFCFTAGSKAGGDGQEQHSAETHRDQPEPQGEDWEQRAAEGDAEGEHLPHKEELMHAAEIKENRWVWVHEVILKREKFGASNTSSG